MGPITLMDEVGIDVGAKATEIIKNIMENDGISKAMPSMLVSKMVVLGKKVSRFYRYENGISVLEDGEKVVDEEIYTTKISQKKEKHDTSSKSGSNQQALVVCIYQ